MVSTYYGVQYRLVRVLAFCYMCQSSLASDASGGTCCQLPQCHVSNTQKRHSTLFLSQTPAMPCSLDAQERERGHTERARHAALADVARLVSSVCLLLALQN